MRKLMIALIRVYQRHISPRTPPSCRFIPTCSAYAIEAIERFGVIRGGAMAAWRLLRCNPLGKPGYDPVPEKKTRPVNYAQGCRCGREHHAGSSDKTSNTPSCNPQDESVSDAEE